jgi:hypothetical protein
MLQLEEVSKLLEAYSKAIAENSKRREDRR